MGIYFQQRDNGKLPGVERRESLEGGMNQTKQLLNQYAGEMGSMPAAINKAVKDAQAGGMTSLIKRGQELRSQYYPALFESAKQYGTGAADMSPTAALSAMLSDVERIGGAYRQNQSLQDYYGTQSDRLAQLAMQGAQMGYGALSDRYNREADYEQRLQDRINRSREFDVNQTYQDKLLELQKQKLAEDIRQWNLQWADRGRTSGGGGIMGNGGSLSDKVYGQGSPTPQPIVIDWNKAKATYGGDIRAFRDLIAGTKTGQYKLINYP